MLRILRFGMGDAGGVVPHSPELDHLPTRSLHLGVQLAVGARVGAVEDVLGEGSVERVPVLTHLGQVAVDAAAAHHHVLGLDTEVALGAAPMAAHHGAVACFQPQHPMFEQATQPVVLEYLPSQRLGDPAPAAPGHVVARQRVAIAEIAALNPLHRREEAHVALAQPVVDIRLVALGIVLGPAPSPMIVGLEGGHAQPVFEQQLRRILHLVAPLLGRAAQQHAAEGIVGLAAAVAARRGIEQQHLAALVEQFQRGADPCQPGTDHQGFTTMKRSTHRASWQTQRQP